MSKPPKILVYLGPKEWPEIGAQLQALLPNYSPGQITEVMCNYGFTSDWRKVEFKCWRISLFSHGSCNGTPDSVLHVRANTEEEALRFYKPDCVWVPNGPHEKGKRWCTSAGRFKSFVLVAWDPEHERAQGKDETAESLFDD